MYSRFFSHLLPWTVLLMPALWVSCTDSEPAPAPPEAGAGGAQGDATGDSQTQELEVLSAWAVSARNVRISWHSPPGKEIVIEREQGGSGTFTEVARKPGDHGRLLDLGLAPETAFRYRLKACAGEACSEPVTTDTITTPASEIPEPTVTVPWAGENDDVAIFGTAALDQTYFGTGHAIAVDRKGTVIWEHRVTGGVINEVEVLPDHNLMVIQLASLVKLDLDGVEQDRYSGELVHHDVDRLSDGRYAVLFFDDFPTDTMTVLGDGIELLGADLSPQWQWLTRDHIALTDYCPICATLPYGPGVGLGQDWTHTNAITFDETEQKLYANVRNLNRIYKIDVATGNVDWVMGDGGDFGAGLWSHSHDPHFLPGNHVMMMDNGLHRAGGEKYSRVIDVVYDPTGKTASISWEYRETPDFYNEAIGGVYPEESGNVMVSDGINGRLVDVTHDEQKAWELLLGTNRVLYKAVMVPRTFFSDW